MYQVTRHLIKVLKRSDQTLKLDVLCYGLKDKVHASQ